MTGVIHANATGITAIQIDVATTAVGRGHETDPAGIIIEEAAQGLTNDPDGAKLRQKIIKLPLRTFKVI